MIRFAEMPRTIEYLDLLYEKMQQFEQWCFTDDLNSKELLARRMTTEGSLYFLAMENDEIVGFTSYHAESLWCGVAHVLFWDRRIRGREGRWMQLCRWVLQQKGWSLLRAYIELEHRTSVKGLERCGWQYDGVLRGSFRKRGALCDLAIFTYPKGVPQHVGHQNGRLPVTLGVGADSPTDAPQPLLSEGPVRGRDTKDQDHDDAAAEHHGTADTLDPTPAGSPVSGRWDSAAFFGLEGGGAKTDAGDHAHVE